MRWKILLCACLFLITSWNPVFAQEPSVILTGYEVTPSVLMPGDRGMITVSLTNTAQAATKTESSTFGTFPVSSITTTRHINPVIESVYLSGHEIKVVGGNAQFEGELGPGQTINLTFLIEAPRENGIFFPVLRVRVRGAESLIYPIPVNVNLPVAILRTPALVVEQPPISFVRPGEHYQTVFTVINEGAGAAEHIGIRILDEDPAITPSRTNFFYIDRLDIGESRSFTVSLLTDRDASPGLRVLPLTLEYSLVDGSRSQQAGSLGLDLRGESKLDLRSVDTDPVRLQEGDQFDLIIRLENTGTGEARSIRATIDLPLQGSKEAYIGTIKKGNDAPAVFILTANQSGELYYRFQVTYQDDWGIHAEDHTLQLVVSPSHGLVVAVVLVILLVSAGGIVWYYLKKKGAA